MVAASPVITCLIAYYVEGDRGHLMDEHVFQRTDAMAYRGNCYSFQMPWGRIVENLSSFLEDDDSLSSLPHTEDVLAKTILFTLRIGNVTDLSKWLPAARIRPHVVLKLMCNLIDRKYQMCSGSPVAQKMKAQLKRQLDARYPEREEEKHLPEDQRNGYIPDAVYKAIVESLRECPGQAGSGVEQKNATPASAPDGMDAVLESLRPNFVQRDRDGRILEAKENREILALERLSRLAVKTQVGLVDQWKSEYPAFAFPFSIPRVVGGADYPLKKRFRRHSAAAVLTPWEHTRMHARRVDSNIKTDWNLVPAERNLTVKWDALCGDLLACKHSVDREKAGNVLAAELRDNATKLLSLIHI